MPKYAYETEAQYRERVRKAGSRDPDTGSIIEIVTATVVGELLSSAFDSPSSDSSSSDFAGGGGDFGGGGASGDF